MTSVSDIRKTFISYFNKNDHEIVRSSSLVPDNDPSLMFVNSGMVQFKNIFTGQENSEYKRAVTSQKCVRAGGKHNDLENVGHTARHHTFFEMLGNFSFGDYFKEKAIYFAWDLLTKEFGFSKDKLLVTYYHDDIEAKKIWKSVSGLDDKKIIAINTNDNFWSMGDTGPCGPCSEIFYDHGESIFGGPPGSKNEDGDRYIEIWNLVFMQFEQLDNQKRINLPRPSIDTGMGLERLAAILQGKHDNYDIDLMDKLITSSAEKSSTHKDGKCKISHRIIVDHLRSSSFLIADGVLPSNEGRGYVLRRIMRRGMRHAHILGCKDPLMCKLVPDLIEEMGDAFPELIEAKDLIYNSLETEENKFKETLDRGIKILDDETKGLTSGQMLDGKVAFKLYDTYGFPFDLTQDILKSKKININEVEFKKEMNIQKKLARSSWKGSGDISYDKLFLEIENKCQPTNFVGYNNEFCNAKVLSIIINSSFVNVAEKGTEALVVFDQTPFYATSGGQIADKGKLNKNTVSLSEHIKNNTSTNIKPLREGNDFVYTVQNVVRFDEDKILPPEIQKGSGATSNTVDDFKPQEPKQPSSTTQKEEFTRNDTEEKTNEKKDILMMLCVLVAIFTFLSFVYFITVYPYFRFEETGRALTVSTMKQRDHTCRTNAVEFSCLRLAD